MATHKNNKPEQSPGNLPTHSMPLFEFTQRKSIPDEHLMTALANLGYLVGRPYRVSPKGRGLFEVDRATGEIRVTADRGKKLLLKLSKYGHLTPPSSSTPSSSSPVGSAQETTVATQKRPPVKYPWRLLMIYRFDKSTEYTVYELDQLSIEDFKQLLIGTMEKAKANGTFPLPPSAPPSCPTSSSNTTTYP